MICLKTRMFVFIHAGDTKNTRLVDMFKEKMHPVFFLSICLLV